MQEQKDTYFPSSRIESLTDGIFAFAMTLLVLSLNAPELHGAVTNSELLSKLNALSDKFFIFLLSFFLLASAWGIHHKQFARISKSDTNLMWINMVRLLLVIIIPFSSVLVGNYSNLLVAVLFFDLNIFLLCVVSSLEWKYAVTHKLTHNITPEEAKSIDTKNMITIVVSGIACVLAFFNTNLSLWAFATIPLVLHFKKLKKE